MGEPSELDWEAIEALNGEARIELIQALIPVALAEVGRTLSEEVERLAGQRHVRKGEGESYYRHCRSVLHAPRQIQKMARRRRGGQRRSASRICRATEYGVRPRSRERSDLRAEFGSRPA